LPIRLASERTKRLVVVVVGAQRIAVRQDELPARQRQDVRIGKQARAAARHKGLAKQEITVAVQQRQPNTAAGQRVQRSDDVHGEGILAIIARVEAIVTRPGFEKIAEDE
jgi:hypothetical protein